MVIDFFIGKVDIFPQRAAIVAAHMPVNKVPPGKDRVRFPIDKMHYLRIAAFILPTDFTFICEFSGEVVLNFDCHFMAPVLGGNGIQQDIALTPCNSSPDPTARLKVIVLDRGNLQIPFRATGKIKVNGRWQRFRIKIFTLGPNPDRDRVIQPVCGRDQEPDGISFRDGIAIVRYGN